LPYSNYFIKVDILENNNSNNNVFLESPNLVLKKHLNSFEDFVKGLVQDKYKIFNFKVNMMKDGFTEDFINDFKKYITSEFLGVSETDEQKYNAILSKIKFLPKSENIGPLGYILSDAGTYDVEIVIKYKNNKLSKKIFDGDKL